MSLVDSLSPDKDAVDCACMLPDSHVISGGRIETFVSVTLRFAERSTEEYTRCNSLVGMLTQHKGLLP